MAMDLCVDVIRLMIIVVVSYGHGFMRRCASSRSDSLDRIFLQKIAALPFVLFVLKMEAQKGRSIL
jgi:hypothetical protein